MIDSGAVAIDDDQIVGFLTWVNRGTETELMWMATLPTMAAASIGKRLFAYCFARIDLAKRVYLRTATNDSAIPGTTIDGTQYERTVAFF